MKRSVFSLFLVLAFVASLIAQVPAHAQAEAMPAGDVQFVTNSTTNSAGWVLVDGTRQWLNASCRAQLEAAGATFTVTSWADISANPNTASPQTCDEIESSIGDGVEPGAASFVTNSATNTAGWALVDGTRQWLNASCRAQLEAAGAAFTVTTWAEISANANTTNPQSCDGLQGLIDDDTTVNDGALYETTVNSNGGFWIVGNQRQWLNNDCITQLRAAGATINAVPWTQIAPTTNTPNLTTCADILAGLDPSDSVSPADILGSLHRTTVNAVGGFYVERNERQWLAPDCMEALVSAGAHVNETSWNGYNGGGWNAPPAPVSRLAWTTEATELVDCDDLLAALEGASPLIYSVVASTDGSIRIAADDGTVAEELLFRSWDWCYQQFNEPWCAGEYQNTTHHQVLWSSWDARFQLVLTTESRYGPQAYSYATVSAVDRTTGTRRDLGYRSLADSAESYPSLSAGFMVGHQWQFRSRLCENQIMAIDLTTGESGCAGSDAWHPFVNN